MVRNLQHTTKKILERSGFTFERVETNGHSAVLWRKRLSPLPTWSTRGIGFTAGAGRGKKLLITPGFGDTPLSWLPVTLGLWGSPRLRQKGYEEILVIEFPGFLGSQAGSRCIPHIEALLETHRSLVDHCRPHTLVGQSMGGYLTAYYAANTVPTLSDENRPEKLILFCPSGYEIEDARSAAWQKLRATTLSGNPDPFIRLALGPALEHPVTAPFMKRVAREMREFLAREDSRNLLGSAGKEHSINSHLRKIQTPTHLAWGEKDELIPFSLYSEWKAELSEALPPNALSTATLPKAAHGVHLDRPHEVIRLITEHAE